LLHRLKPKSEFSRNVLTLMTGTTIAQAIPLAISPVLTRLYTPEDFGIFALFVAVVGIFSTISSGRYEMALLLPKKTSDAMNVLVLSFLINLAFSLCLLLITIIFGEWIVHLFNSEQMAFWLYFIPLTVFVVGLFNQLSVFNNRQKNYRDIAQASIVKAIVLATIQLGMGFAKSGAAGLISGQIVAQLSANVKLAKNIFSTKNFFHEVSRLKMFSLAKRYKDFPQFNLPHALFSTLSSNLPVYLFTPFFGSTVVGYYSFSLMIVFTPLMILAGATAKVYSQQVVALYHKKENAYLFTMKMLFSLGKKVLLLFLVILLFAPSVFSVLFGETWREAGQYTQILAPFLFLNVLVSTIAFIPNLVGAQKKAFLVSFVHVALLSSVLYYFSIQGEVYSALVALSIINSAVLLYNLNWMLRSLKS